jgi:hypothetical protein
MFLTQSVKTGIALHALIAIDGGPFDDGIYVNGAHWAYIGAIPARNALIRVDSHNA